MNILITGANGLIGRNLIKILSKKNKIYTVITDKKNLTFELNKNIYIIELNLTDFNTNILPKNIDIIYYLAQSKKFRDFPDGSEDVLLVNVVAPIKIANWAIKNGVKKFIYTSSGGIYTNTKKPVKEFFEINANEKLGFYLNSKLSAEMLLRNYARMFETFVILRPFFVYGPKQDKSMLIPRLINNIIEGKEIILNGKEGIKLNPIFVNDAVIAIKNTLKLKGEYIINIAGKEIVSIKGLSFLIGNLIGKNPIFSYQSMRQKDLIANIELMTKLLYEPKIILKEGILNVIKQWD